ncbi:MAG: hypothetical protein H6822_33135 [Planctomycetaceae bacterium]|nr:hypothetical protein [Planctomycetaceae bacterium]
MATTVEKLGCVCGFECETAKELYHHRKRVHGEDGSVAYAYAGRAIQTQRRLQRQGAGVESEVDTEVEQRLKRHRKKAA